MLPKNEKEIMEAKKQLINLYLIVKPQKLEEVYIYYHINFNKNIYYS